jgi:hypothetical protein
MNPNLPISEQYRIIAEQWVDADAAANLLEDTKSAVLSQKMLALGEKSVAKAEMIVKGSPEWNDHIVKMTNARKAANKLKVQMEYIRMKGWEVNSFEATKRAEMKL